MRFEVLEQNALAMGGAATLKRIAIILPNGAEGSLTLTLSLFVPNAVAGPAPAMLLINHRPQDEADPTRQIQSEFWPAEAVVARGFAIAAFQAADIDPDNPAFDNGVHALFDGGERQPNSWGTLAAWAWEASRVMDYFETEPRIDTARVAVVGHSRGGKAALVAGATDTRFALMISNNSGEGGAALARCNQGEGIAQINASFPHCFALNFRNYNGAPEELPVDAHELIALMAPRGVYVASASEDAWADPLGEFLAALRAAPVYELYGFSGLGDASFPEPGQHIHGEQIGYHLRQGEHDLKTFDWERYMDFFATVKIDSEPAGGAGGVGGAGAVSGSSFGGSAAGATGSAAAPPVGGGGLFGSGAVPSAPSAGSDNGAAASASGCACDLGGRSRDRAGGLITLFALAALARRKKQRPRV